MSPPSLGSAVGSRVACGSKFRAAKLYEKALSKQNKCCLNRGFDLKGGWRGTPICILVNILIFQKIICRSDTLTAFKFVTK